MKFVAKTSFHNAPELGLKLDAAKTPNYAHDLHVPKGHRFEIAPEAKSLKGINKQDEKQLVSKLVMLDLVAIDDGSPESADTIKRIDSEVKNENEVTAAAAKKAKAAETLTVAAILAQLPDMIAAAVAAAKK